MAKREGNHRANFLVDNPNLYPVSGSELEKILRWAADNDYVKFVLFEGEEFYSDFDAKVAVMWDSKCNRTND